jgi:hypothetical protein
MEGEQRPLAVGRPGVGPELEAGLERVLGQEEAAAVLRVRASAVGPACLREEANLAWAMAHQRLLISCPVAVPTCSPRAKGGETTLEPYLTLKPFGSTSAVQRAHHTSRAHPFNTRKVAPDSCVVNCEPVSLS